MQQKLTLTYGLFCLTLFSSVFLGYSGGYDGELAGAPGEGTCANCHGGGPGSGSVTLTGAPAAFTRGQSYPLTLTIQHPSALDGGFQIVATNGINNTMVGTFTAGANSRLTDSRLTHSARNPFSEKSASWTFNWTAPTVTPPANVVFYYVGNATNRNGGTSGDDVLTNNTSTVLPVELLYFKAVQGARNEVNLSWSTASERENAVFNVEKSADNQKFETIASLKGNGTSAESQRYQFTDATATLNTAYYRLQQVDFNGKTTYSKTISVRLESKAGLKIYPNLAKTGDILRLEATGTATIDIVDMNGRIVKTIARPTNVLTETININTDAFQSGRYFVRSQGNNLVQTASFIVL